MYKAEAEAETELIELIGRCFKGRPAAPFFSAPRSSTRTRLSMPPPSLLQAMAPFLAKAKDLSAANQPTIAYYCKLYAASMGFSGKFERSQEGDLALAKLFDELEEVGGKHFMCVAKQQQMSRLTHDLFLFLLLFLKQNKTKTCQFITILTFTHSL